MEEAGNGEIVETVGETALAQRPEKAPIRIGERGLEFESAAEVYRMAAAFASGGVAPKGMNVGAVMAAILKGRALGLDEITSVTSIVVINGRTQMSGSLLLALLRRAGVEYDVWHTGEGNQREAHIRAWWPGKKDRQKERSFSMAEAARAGLATKDTYKAWPDDMLLWRAVAKLARQEFPEIAAGIYVHGEIPGDPVVSGAAPEQAGTESAPRPAPGADPMLADLAPVEVEPLPEPAVRCKKHKDVDLTETDGCWKCEAEAKEAAEAASSKRGE